MIDVFLEYLLLEKKYSPHTITAYKNDLLSFRDFLVSEYDQENLSEAHYAQIRNWVVALVGENLSNRTINRKISSLKSLYKFLLKTSQIEFNPLSQHKSLKTETRVQVPFTSKEINAVISQIEVNSDFISVRDKLIVELFYSTGIRRVELINIRVSDISLEDSTIKVVGKRKKERYVPLIDSVVQTLKKYLELKKDFSIGLDALFITKKGNKIYETLVYRIINSYFSTVSSKEKKSPHILRHSFATHLLNEGANLNSVKELLGHSSLAATQVYIQNSLDAIKKVYNQAYPRRNKNEDR